MCLVLVYIELDINSIKELKLLFSDIYKALKDLKSSFTTKKTRSWLDFMIVIRIDVQMIRKKYFWLYVV